MKNSMILNLIPDNVLSNYRLEILNVLVGGAEEYLAKSVVPVYQISIWTDLQSAISCVNFETKENALKTIARSVQFWIGHGNYDEAERLRELVVNGNPADFKYARIFEGKHSSLKTILDAVDINHDIQNELELILEKHLLEMIDVFVKEPVFLELPKEDDVYIGVSSPLDWYDDVRIWHDQDWLP